MTNLNYPRYRGKIVSVHLDKGFGFVAHKMSDDEVIDVFFHISELKSGSAFNLIPDEEAERSGKEQFIEYSLTTKPYKRSRSDRELRAVDCVLIPHLYTEVTEDEVFAAAIEKLERSLTRTDDRGALVLDEKSRDMVTADIQRLTTRRQALAMKQ